MSFSTGWQARFAAGKSKSQWPWSDVISYTMRHAKPGPGTRVLELGCGAGANVPFFLDTRSDYYAVEGSESAIEEFRARYPGLDDRVKRGDFTAALPFEPPFDIILDRSAVTHNDHAAIERTLALAHASLGSGGHYIGIDWFSSRHAEAQRGKPLADGCTRTFEAGLFEGIGKVHFSDEAHLRKLFAAFTIVAMDEKSYEGCEPPRSTNATWIVVARKGT